MAITFQRDCSCGASLVFEGSRREEREALDKWAVAHGGCNARASSPESETTTDFSGVTVELVEVHRDAGTGEFVSEEFAEEHPTTTVADTVPKVSRRRRREAS